MNYGNIKECDIADGPGVRVSLFVSGCRHHCKGCFNEETWDFGFGQHYTEETEAEILRLLGAGFVQVYFISCLIGDFRGHNFRAETMIDISCSKFEVVFGRWIIIEVDLVIPIIDSRTVIG